MSISIEFTESPSDTWSIEIQNSDAVLPVDSVGVASDSVVISMLTGSPATIELVAGGIQGDKGDKGDPGSVDDYDPGDLTVYFDNGLR